MARVLLLTCDPRLGPTLKGMLSAAGHSVEVVDGENALRQSLLSARAGLVIAQLTEHQLAGVQEVRELREEGFLDGVPLLGYYLSADPGVRDLAIGEGFDLVVPRSRMEREGATLVAGLLPD